MNKYMEVINEFFENCKVETIQMMKENNTELNEAREAEYIEVEYSFENGDGTTHKWTSKEWLLDHNEFKKLTKFRSRSVYAKQKSMYYYEPKDGIELTDEQKDWFERVNRTPELKEKICERYPSKMIDFVFSPRWERIESEAIEYVSKFFEAKKQNLIDNIQAKGGAIIDAITIFQNLGELNGDFKCENGIVRINTIFAGGYNIQCLHIRNLVKLLKH